MKKSKKRLFKKIYIALFLAMICLPWLVWGGVRVFAPEVYAEQSDLSREKRTKNELDLKELLISGQNLSAFIDDRVPFRGGMIDIYQNAEGKTENVYRDLMRKVTAFFSGKGPEQKEVKIPGLISDGSEGISSDDTSPNEPGDVSQQPENGSDHEHSLSVVEQVEPDCENGGYILYKCDNCDYTYKEVLEPTHNFIMIKESEASYESYGYKLYECMRCGRFKMEDFVSKYVDTTYMAPQTVGGVMIGRFNWLFYAGEHNMDYFTGSNVLSDEEMAQYAELVNRLKSLCEARGIAPFIMFMPNKEQVYSEYMPTMEIVNDYKRTKRLTDYLNQHTTVDCQYPIDELKSADVYWPVYYKYDSHWNHMGAYVGLTPFYNLIGVETSNPWLLNLYPTDNVRTDLITFGGFSAENFPPDSEIMIDYHPEVYVEGLFPYQDVCHTYASGARYDVKVVVLSDSYREMMTPFMAKDFRELVSAHRDFTDQCAEDIKNCNILLITAVERDDKLAFECIKKVISILE